MAQLLSLEIDPSQVLGVRPGATLEEIRDAYRTKVKRHHPDQGGEDWAFKVLVQAYEMLSTSRVMRAAAQPEPPRRSRPSDPPRPPRSEPPPKPKPAPTGETLREGVSEKGADPSRVVDVEKLALKHQMDQLWLVTEHANEDRFLSCSLNLSWPSADFKPGPGQVDDRETILRDLQAVFDELADVTSASSAESAVVEGRFSGWLTYPGGDQAGEAFDRLRHRLHKFGLAVHQWSRDVLIPRQRR